MRQRITSSLKTLVTDRSLVTLLSIFLIGCAALLVYYVLTIHPSELQVVNRYTSFGTTNFYRDKWYYLISFAVFVVLMAAAHVALCYRVFITKGHELAVAFAWLGIALLIITAALSYQVLNIASLT